MYDGAGGSCWRAIQDSNKSFEIGTLDFLTLVCPVPAMVNVYTGVTGRGADLDTFLGRALTDPATGLPNVPYFCLIQNWEQRRARRRKTRSA